MKKRKVGEVAPNHIPVIDKYGFVRGYVHGKATGATAARFTNNPAMKLGRHEGRQAWIEQDTGERAPQPHRPETANHKSARGSVRAK
jgi:hypothetical protein